jgi:hypothetical protein
MQHGTSRATGKIKVYWQKARKMTNEHDTHLILLLNGIEY